MNKLIAPSILNADFSNLQQQIRYLEMGGADLIHCDIMDGHFVPNISFGPTIVGWVSQSTALPLDVHLMIENADAYLEKFYESGAKIITVHQEALVHLNRTITRIKDLGIKAGVSINPATPVSLLHNILEYVDLVLIMSVNPGFGGQKFIKSSLNKIEELALIRQSRNLDFLIEVDGGIDLSNARQVSSAGCDVFVIGSAILRSENITASAMEFKNLVNSINV